MPEARLTPTSARNGADCPEKRFLAATRLSTAACVLVTLRKMPSIRNLRAAEKKEEEEEAPEVGRAEREALLGGRKEECPPLKSLRSSNFPTPQFLLCPWRRTPAGAARPRVSFLSALMTSCIPALAALAAGSAAPVPPPALAKAAVAARAQGSASEGAGGRKRTSLEAPYNSVVGVLG